MGFDERTLAARTYAISAHRGQFRKYTGEPYYHHTFAVALAVMTIAGHTVEMIEAAILHDVLEDTASTCGDLKAAGFSDHTVSLVIQLTDIAVPEDGNRAVRKGIERDRLALVSAEAQSIKLCDLIDNTSSIVEHAPDFAKIYMAEKAELLKVLTRGDAVMHARASAIVADYYVSMRSI